MKKGVIFALAGYAIWGFFPLYFKTLQAAPAFQIMAHRVVWSFLLMAAILIFRKEMKSMLSAVTPRIVFLYAIAGTLLAINWVTYVWGVNAGYVVEASLGYFINPLVSVLLGVIFLRERLRPLQWVPVVLAAAGVTYLTVSMGKLPWIALVLAFSFGLYGLMKKITPLGSLQGLTLETAAVFLPAFAFLIIEQVRGVGAFVNAGVSTTLLLAATGVVTAIPLIFFSAGTKLIPLTTVGLLQYITPTTQFLLGVFVFKEAFSSNQVVGFVIIWIALILFTVENLLHNRPVRARLAVSTASSSSKVKN
ncbi:MAG: EamA family transporter RarD [Bellilinea sp.]